MLLWAWRIRTHRSWGLEWCYAAVSSRWGIRWRRRGCRFSFQSGDRVICPTFKFEWTSRRFYWIFSVRRTSIRSSCSSKLSLCHKWILIFRDMCCWSLQWIVVGLMIRYDIIVYIYIFFFSGCLAEKWGTLYQIIIFCYYVLQLVYRHLSVYGIIYRYPKKTGIRYNGICQRSIIPHTSSYDSIILIYLYLDI